MGYSKVVRVSDHKVRLEHQLNSDGTPYAEDITLEIAASVDPSRLSHWQDGATGIVMISFSSVDISSDVIFPSDRLR